MSSTPTHPGPSPPPPHDAQPSHPHPPPAASTTSSSSGRRPHDGRKGPLSLSKTRPFRPNPSSTSVAPSTAEGKAIHVDDTTADHGTLALREINNHYPSRHRYAKSTGAQSSTYSEPVIVRTYYSPDPSRHDTSTRRPCSGGAASKAGGPRTGAAAHRLVFASPVPPPAGSGMPNTVARTHGGIGVLTADKAHQVARLPPIEAFSFTGFLAGTGTRHGAVDINSDLDRIAEICARSRYSLSNQYEVHYAPHGSGASFLASAQNQDQDGLGPTLQAVPTDEEQNLQGSTLRRRRAGRRNSRAVGTLETIMSSSRSSDEERAKKKSASEVAASVRGRAAREATGSASPSWSPASSPVRCGRGMPGSRDDGPRPAPRTRPPSTSLALMDKARQGGGGGASPDASTRRTSSSALLVGEPASPQPSGRQLEVGPTKTPSAPTAEASDQQQHPAKGDAQAQQGTLGRTVLSTLAGWLLPWTPAASARPEPRGRAESSLRDLLHHAEPKDRHAPE